MRNSLRIVSREYGGIRGAAALPQFTMPSVILTHSMVSRRCSA